MDPELLQTLMQNPDQGRELVQAMIAERAAGNPSLAALLQMMSQRESEPESAADPDAPIRPRSDRNERLDRVRARVHEMRGELAQLRERVARFAAAVGACAACWGEDDGCASCGGEGSAGWLDPDPMAFAELVAPAVARLADTTRDSGEEA